jgi:hypothetical protein
MRNPPTIGTVTGTKGINPTFAVAWRELHFFPALAVGAVNRAWADDEWRPDTILHLTPHQFRYDVDARLLDPLPCATPYSGAGG